MSRPVESFTWAELRKGYLQYDERLRQIAQYLNIADDKRALNPTPGEVWHVTDYTERLWLDRQRIGAKRDIIKAEVIRRSSLIGVFS